MSAPRILIRCDGSRQIGLGHISRCASLAHALRSHGAEMRFVLAGGPKDLAMLDGFDTTVMTAGDSTDEARELAALATEFRASWIVIDRARPGTGFLDDLRRRCDPKLCVMVDEPGQEWRPADLVVCATALSEPWFAHLSDRPVVFAGPRYALIHPAFLAARPESVRRRSGTSFRTVLITLGGSDPAGLSLRVAEIVHEALPGAEVRVVLGPAAAVVDTDSVVILRGLSPGQMAEQMAWSDLAIATPSTTAWELSCMGVPSVLIPAVDNQRPNAAALKQLAVTTVCETVDGLGTTLAALVNEPNSVRIHRDQSWAALCDGQGASHVAAYLCGVSALKP